MVAPPSSLRALFAATNVQAPEDTIGFLLWRVAHRHQREVDRVLAPLNLTHLQFIVMAQTGWLTRDGAVVTQAELAAFSKIHPMQLSSILKILEAKGLVVRERSAADTRRKRMALTPAAITLLRDAIPRVTTLQTTFFGDDPAFNADLHARLRRVVAGWGDDP